MGTMSIRAYAREAGADERAIRRAIESGIIELDDQGRVDPVQADRAWRSTRRASRLGQNQIDDAGTRSARAKIAVAIAKLRALRASYEAERDRYVDRAEAIEVGRSEAQYTLDSLRAAPAIYAASFAAELGIAPELASTILHEFIALALAEIGDLEAQAVRDAKRS
jgi:hypothetical protein